MMVACAGVYGATRICLKCTKSKSSWLVPSKGLLCMLASFVAVVTPLWLLGLMGVAYGS